MESSGGRLRDFLRTMVEVEASDLHLRAGSRPIFRVNSRLRLGKNFPELTTGDTANIADELLSEEKKKIYLEKKEVDLSYSAEGISRFRVNIFRQRGAVNIVLRLVPAHIKSIDELNLPGVIKKISESHRGLILVTGTTGSGKSATLAAMIDHINRNIARHIITIEDPIEYIHSDIKSIISQRELGVDTYSYPEALKHVVRQDPDVILIGEMRDIETMSAAITAAQTGHLVLATTHTINASKTLSRVVDMFPPHHQNQIRLSLADTITAVISQRLLPRIDCEGMIPAVEVLTATSLIKSLIEEGKLSSVSEQIEKGEYYGMQSFNQSLELLCREEKVSLEDARKASTNPEDLMLKIRGIKSESDPTG